MIKGKDFVMTGLQPWDIPIGSNARDIALEISQNNRVLYVNTPLSRWSSDLKSDKVQVQQRVKVLRREAPPVRKISDNLWVLDFPFTILPANSLPDGKLFDVVNRINNRKIFLYIKKILAELNFDNVIHIIDNDIYRSFYSKFYLKPFLSIYYRRDNLLAIDFWRRHACRLEPLLIAASDLVVCNSAHLAAVARENNIKTYDIGQGVDLSDCTALNRVIPTDTVDIPKPIIGYLGDITSLRLDPDLIYNLAQRNPKSSFVLVGGIDDVFKKHELNSLSNVYFLGPKNRNTVIDYINTFDICINPQLINELTIGNYPRKIDEYLAMGKPTVATRTQTMQVFDDYVYNCSSVDEYHSAIQAILRGELKCSTESMIAFAHTHTWQSSVDALYKIIDQNR